MVDEEKKSKKGQSAAAAALTAATKGATEPEPESGSETAPELMDEEKDKEPTTPSEALAAEQSLEPQNVDANIIPTEANSEPILMDEEKDKEPVKEDKATVAAVQVQPQEYLVLEDQMLFIGFQHIPLKSGQILDDHSLIQTLLKEGAAIAPVTNEDLTVCPKCTHRFVNC